MKTIIVMSEKGGTGKTTLARELHAHFSRQNFRTSFYSFDAQYSDSTIKADDPEIVILDTPGILINQDLKDTVTSADAIVIPVRPTPLDIEPFTRTISLLKGITKAPIVIAVNFWNRFRVCAQFMEWLYSKNWATILVRVPQSETIVQAQMDGVSVVDYAPKNSAAAAVVALGELVGQLLGINGPNKISESDKSASKNNKSASKNAKADEVTEDEQE